LLSVERFAKLPAWFLRSRLAAAAPLLPISPPGLATVVVAPEIRIYSLRRSSVPSLAPFFGSSALRSTAVTAASSLLRPLLTSPRLSPQRSPQVRCRICSLAPPGSTRCVLMTFGLRCSQPACRPHLASLPVRIPTVEGLLPASFSFTSRLRLAVHYGCRHRLRLAPFIQL